MYKIYINDTPLFLMQSAHAKMNLPGDDKNLVARYPGKEKILLSYIDMLEKSDRWDSIVLYADDVEQLIADFERLFKILEAAGGLVYNEEEEILLIYRRGFWDLPKGKIDPGETKEAAAVREVEEETGLKNLNLHNFLKTTYHTYRNKKNKRIIKKTYWFRMTTSKDQILIPQAEEDIEKVIWSKIQTFLSTEPKIYGNILDILNFSKDNL